MFTNHYPLTTNTELFAAALFQSPVTVIQNTADDIPCVLVCDGNIEKYTPSRVKVNGTYYSRDECEFYAKVSEDTPL